MKKTFTLIIGSLIVVSIMAQTANRSIPVNKLHNGIDFFGLKMFRNNGLKTNYQFNYREKSPSVMKSAQVVKQRLDSLISKKYDALTSLYINSYKEVFTYSVNGKLSKYYEYTWNENNNKWVGEYGTESFYDASGNKIRDINYNWKIDVNQWISSYKSEYSFNNKGAVTQELYYDWDVVTNQWIVGMKTDNTYDANGNIILATFYYKDTNTGVLTVSYKQEYTYNTNGKIAQRISSNYMPGFNNDWIPNYKYEYSYDTNGNETQLHYLWNFITNKWDNSGKDLTNYDSKGNQTQWISYDWDNSVSQWVGSDKEEITYDSNGNMILYVYSKWDKGTNLWVNDSKEDYAYNNSYSSSDLLLPFTDTEIRFNHMITSGFSYDWNKITSQWVVSEKYSLHYSPMNVSGIEAFSNDRITIYPNPAKEYITFDLNDVSFAATIELFDIQGKKIISQLLPINKQISVSQLKNGMYFYLISQNEQIYKGKIMIE